MNLRTGLLAVICYFIGTSFCFSGSCWAFGPELPEPLLVPHDEEQPKPWTGLYPKFGTPAKHIYVVRADLIPKLELTEWWATVAGLVGLVNRAGQPQIYVQALDDDPWPKVFLDQGLITKITELTADEFIDKFQSYAKGAVVYDKSKYASRAAAGVVAACEGLAIVSPDHINDVPWPVVRDLRGKFSTDAEAYWWAFNNYWDECCHWALAMVKFNRNLPCIDACVGYKVFPFYVMPNKHDELEFAQHILANTPPNTPVYVGYSPSGGDGLTEHHTLRLISWYGKISIGGGWGGYNNYTLVPGWRPSKPFTQPPVPPPPELDESKVYYAMLLSEGDSMYHTWYWKRWHEPERGYIPFGWGLNGASWEVQAAVLPEFYDNATPNDQFINECLAGYNFPDVFGAAYQEQYRRGLFKEMMNYVKQYMANLDLRVCHILPCASFYQKQPGYLERVNRVLDDIAVELQSSVNLVAMECDYGAHGYYGAGTANSMLPRSGLPLFHAMAPFRTWQADRDKIISDLTAQIGSRRPAFAMVFPVIYRTPMADVKYIADNLPSDYVPVFHEQLAKLYSQYKPDPPEVGTYDTDFDYDDQELVTSSVKTVLGPAFTERKDDQGKSPDYTLSIKDGDLVIADTDGGSRWESAMVKLNPDRAASFSDGYTAEVTVAGSTIEAIRDGTIAEGLAVGMSNSGGSNDPLYCFAALRRPKGADVFDIIFPGSDMDEQVGYYTVWQISGSGHTLHAFKPIRDGTLGDVTFKVVVDSGKTADFYVNDIPLIEDISLGDTCMDMVGMMVQQWGVKEGNAPFSGVAIKHFKVTGLAVPNGPTTPPANDEDSGEGEDAGTLADTPAP